MLKRITLSTPEELEIFYKNFFGEFLYPEAKVLYVGYEDEDLLLPIIAGISEHIVALDREPRSNGPYSCVQYLTMDFQDIRNMDELHFDYTVFSLILHENDFVLHKSFLNIAQSISESIIVIEPLSRNDDNGIMFEKYISSYFTRKGQIKRYYDESYWKEVTQFDLRNDQCYILERCNIFCDRYFNDDYGVMRPINLQDILIIIKCSQR